MVTIQRIFVLTTTFALFALVTITFVAPLAEVEAAGPGQDSEAEAKKAAAKKAAEDDPTLEYDDVLEIAYRPIPDSPRGDESRLITEEELGE